MKCGIVVFPGSNCDRDSFHILKEILGLETEWIWHKENSLKKFDLIVTWRILLRGLLKAWSYLKIFTHNEIHNRVRRKWR